MKFSSYTAKNHKALVCEAIAKAQRAIEELDKRERNLRRPDGWPRYSPPEEAEHRLTIDAARQAALAARDQVITSAREVAETGIAESQAAIARIDRLQQNPIGRLQATDAANVRALVELLEAGFGRSSFAEMLAQVNAAVGGTNRDQQVAALEVIQRRMATLQAGERLAGVALLQHNQLDEVATALVKKLRDPDLARERIEHVEGLQAAEDLLADVRAQDHPIRVAEAQEKLVATGNYGERVAGPTVLRNIQEAPVPQMVEMD